MPLQSSVESASLFDQIAKVLPFGCEYSFHHISTPPTKCDPLFAPPPGRKPEKTYCESQFLTVSVQSHIDGADGVVLAFAIELLVYTTRRLTTIFVSKADSTGYLSSSLISQALRGSPIRTITSTFISWLARCRSRPGVRLVVSLFARAQSQYLFPGSAENPGKHVLDDRQLVKWWCKTLDPVLRQSTSTGPPPSNDAEKDETANAQAYVIVPGFDKHETASFFPPTSRTDPSDDKKWKHGHPLSEISPTPAAPPRCLVPHFPDDPKARFLDELDEEVPDSTNSQTLASPSKKGLGMWKSIKTLDQFWEMMAFRQECSSGRLVGFIWVVFTPSDVDSNMPDEVIESQFSMSSQNSVTATQQEQPPIAETPNIPTTSSAKQRRGSRLTGPIVSRRPRIKSSSSTLSATLQPETSPFWRWEEISRGQVVLDQNAYTRVHDLLLRLDFANHAAAAMSTAKWIAEVAVMTRSADDWGKIVKGLQEQPVGLANGSSAPASANDLSGSIVRKKRKAVGDGGIDGADAALPPAVNVLSSSMVRKKPKTR